jgi:hypothetical protein
MKDLGDVNQYLGMEVSRDWDKHKVYLSQHKDIQVLLKRSGQEDAKEYDTLLLINHNLTKAEEGEEEHPDQHRYPELVRGSCTSWCAPDQTLPT